MKTNTCSWTDFFLKKKSSWSFPQEGQKYHFYHYTCNGAANPLTRPSLRRWSIRPRALLSAACGYWEKEGRQRRHVDVLPFISCLRKGVWQPPVTSLWKQNAILPANRHLPTPEEHGKQDLLRLNSPSCHFRNISEQGANFSWQRRFKGSGLSFSFHRTNATTLVKPL